jgi:hypothetical protein
LKQKHYFKNKGKKNFLQESAMFSTLQSPARLALVLVIACPVYGLLLLGLWWGLARQTRTPRPASHLLALALWLIFSPFLLYGLQFVLPDLMVYFLYLLLGMIFVHLYSRYFVEKNDFVPEKSVAQALIAGVLPLCTLTILPFAISNILLTFSPMDFTPVLILSYGGAVVWPILNITVLWVYGKRKQRDMVPFWSRRKEKG